MHLRPRLRALRLTGLTAVLCLSGLGPANASKPSAEPVAFTRHVVDPALPGAAFAIAADVLGGPAPELVASGFGTFLFPPGGPPVQPAGGELAIYRKGGSLDEWTKVPVFGAEEKIAFPNMPAAADVDRDGDRDLIVPGGFFQCAPAKCGSLTWWERQRTAWKRHDLVAPGSGPLFYHKAVVADLDRDGRRDLVTIGEAFPAPVALLPGLPPANAWVQMFPGLRGGGFATTPVTLGPGGGALPEVADVDRDGDLDVASAQYFQPGASHVWLEQTRKDGFVPHVIDTGEGKAIQLSLVRNLYGDHRSRWVGSNHTNTATPGEPESRIVSYAVPADPRNPWTATPLSEGIVSRPRPGQGAPGVFGHGDVDGDGDVDLLVSGDGDPRLFWLEQHSGRRFETHVLAENAGQAGGAIVADLDRDRRDELAFTIFESNTVAVWSRDR
ncbi:hypothetical protein GCM10010468_40000 [Actinocorallia longicatena]|uniref:VCBS repeat protein n=2 Tax=Actinocorallia longicatena TaxID=111803 RepID=A0ABP6QCB5_9ACTN